MQGDKNFAGPEIEHDRAPWKDWLTQSPQWPKQFPDSKTEKVMVWSVFQAT